MKTFTLTIIAFLRSLGESIMLTKLEITNFETAKATAKIREQSHHSCISKDPDWCGSHASN